MLEIEGDLKEYVEQTDFPWAILLLLLMFYLLWNASKRRRRLSLAGFIFNDYIEYYKSFISSSTFKFGSLL